MSASIASLLVLSVLSQSYTRSRVDEANSNSQCLWWLENTTITYHQNIDGNPETPGATEFLAFQRAFATWQNQLTTCGNLSFQEGSTTSSRSVGYVDKGTNENIVLFRQKTCANVSSSDSCWGDDNCGNVYDCWQFSNSAIAITTTSYNPTNGRIYDSDIELNTPAFVFTTVNSPVCPAGHYTTACVATDVQNTATHEIGHLLGLAHNSTSGSTMNPRADPGELSKRVLDDGSLQFVCQVYPKGKPSQTCFTPPLSSSLGKSAGCTTAVTLESQALLALVVFVARRRSR